MLGLTQTQKLELFKKIVFDELDMPEGMYEFIINAIVKAQGDHTYPFDISNFKQTIEQEIKLPPGGILILIKAIITCQLHKYETLEQHEAKINQMLKAMIQIEADAIVAHYWQEMFDQQSNDNITKSMDELWHQVQQNTHLLLNYQTKF